MMASLRKALPLTAAAIVLMIWAALPDSDERLPAAPSELMEAQVTRVWDGDTLHAQVEGETLKIRLIGMDCPEVGERAEPLGEDARSRAEALAEGQTVWLEADSGDRDKYGRALRYVWLERPTDTASFKEAPEKMLNAILLSEGLAEVMAIPPNTRWADDFETLEAEARRSGLGIWQE